LLQVRDGSHRLQSDKVHSLSLSLMLRCSLAQRMQHRDAKRTTAANAKQNLEGAILALR
jgi:hypothetical protein